MALNLDHLTEFARLARPEIYERGKLYFYNNMIRRAEVDIRRRRAYFEIIGSEPEPYIVEIKDFTTPAISASCTCPYDKGMCKHQVAALLYLKENFERLAQEYNQRFYPHLPMKETVRFIDRYLDEFKPFYPDNFHKGAKLARKGMVKVKWINPLLQKARLIINDATVELNDYLTPAVNVNCTCMRDFCEHKVAACLWLKKYFTEPSYQKTKSRYLRQGNKFVMLGTVYEVRSADLHDFLPSYLPEEFDLLKLEQGYIRLRIKVRYRRQIVEFLVRGNYILSRCSCDDDVPGVCKHQIAAVNLLNNLDRRFFTILASDKAWELQGLFI